MPPGIVYVPPSSVDAQAFYDDGAGNKILAVYADGGSGGGGTPSTNGPLTDRSGTITSGGTAQTIAALNASRKYFFIQNLSTDTLWINFGVAAVVGWPSMALPPATSSTSGNGGTLEYTGSFIPSGLVSVLGATTGDAFAAKEG